MHDSISDLETGGLASGFKLSHVHRKPLSAHPFSARKVNIDAVNGCGFEVIIGVPHRNSPVTLFYCPAFAFIGGTYTVSTEIVTTSDLCGLDFTWVRDPTSGQDTPTDPKGASVLKVLICVLPNVHCRVETPYGELYAIVWKTTWFIISHQQKAARSAHTFRSIRE